MPENLPPVSRRRAAVTMLKFGWAADHTGTVLAFALFGSQAAAQSLFAYWLKLLIDGLRPLNLAELVLAAVGIAVSILGSNALAYAASRVEATLRDRTQRLLNQRMLELIGRTPTLDLHETPEHLVQLDTLRREGHAFATIIPSLLNFFATAIRIVITTLLLLSIHPLLLLLPLFGLPRLLISGEVGDLFRLGMELAAEPARRAQHLSELTGTPGGAKEIRLFRLGGAMLDRFHTAHREIRAINHRLQTRAAYLGMSAQIIFLLGYLGAILFVTNRAINGHATVGDTILIAVLAGQILGLVTGSAEILDLTVRSLVAAGRYVYLQDVAGQARASINPAATVPDRLTTGIRLDHVSYQYPQADQPSLHDVTLTLPAGATIAIVGENGAGKSTLIKLLTGMYQPTTGIITCDHTDLASIDPDRWRDRITAGFQDHARFEFLLRETIGIGDLSAGSRIPNDQQIRDAMGRAGATEIANQLPAELETQLGSGWPSGVDISGGQWQQLAISRAMMRTNPILLVLDEPTAALDADTEHRLFHQWATASRQLREGTGTITVLVSHRFSTVRMADHIIVLNHGQIIEHGNHDQLIQQHGLYAELFELQARAYQ